MTTTTFLLFHALRPLADPVAVQLWQQELGARLGVQGGVVVSPQGLQGIVGGDRSSLEQYAFATRRHPACSHLRFRWSEGRGLPLPPLRVTVQEEVAGFGAADERATGLGQNRQLTPTQMHELIAARGADVVLFDGRNSYEAEVGRFHGAVVPDANAARDILRELDSGKFDALKNRPVVTYCVGGLRSEILASLMAKRGFGEVYFLDGGIVSYGSTYADDGLWQGALYVLGHRVQIVFSDHPAALGRCEACGARTSTYRECIAPLCSQHALLCNGCADFALCLAHRN